ncbi:hypothetical protein AYM40_15625 [Paraburkholderia phytofirmans OLGA172]|uniref:Uncharacterized protein n=1 Tax=Paraburkholderia phytofirmans OLGA172 TaxID=1417228 RepID=A0A167W2N7_9BURK|nr:tetratricopeptide repeat protein [Paraburkholderia phytofirmans]ANB73627.1 hypothetical protein AYM40_15625 [Paraburkholderia phytofirmans OLGA172]
MSTMTDAKDYIQKAIELRVEGRLDEAVLVARKATELATDDANSWWQLALAQSAKNALAQTISALEKVTELAPHFAEGWCQLGLAHKKVARLDKAISYYEQALTVNAEHIPSLSLLNTALAEREGKTDAKRRLEVLRTLQRLSPLDGNELFALAYLLTEQREFLEAARVYEDYTREFGGGAAHYNLGLVYENLGRDADAIDAYRRAAMMDGADTSAEDHVQKLLPRLLTLRKQVLGKASPSPKQEDWYRHYINPFVLLNVNDASELHEPKALQKAKQAVFREIELENGKVEWMPGLSIDKSTAMTLLEPLSDAVQWDVHQAIFENKPLCDFLMRGHLMHFLVEEDPADSARMPHEAGRPMLETISQRFAQQYAMVLTKSIEQGDLQGVECLFDGRRWVLPEDEERCFEGARRAVERLCEPLRRLTKDAEQRKVTLSEVESAFKKGSLDRMAMHLPSEFYETHATICGLLRSLSVDIYNNGGGAEVAKAILDLSRVSAAKSPALAHQFAEDDKALNERIASEKENEAHLTFGNANLDITKTGVIYGNKEIAVADISAVRWGMVLTSNSPRTVRFRIAFKDAAGTDIDVTWSTKDVEAQQKFWGQLVDATLHYLMDAIVANFKKRLKSATPTRVGTLEIQDAGVVFETTGWFSSKKVLCAWTNLASIITNGDLVLRDITNSKATATLNLDSTDNAFLLHLLAEKRVN